MTIKLWHVAGAGLGLVAASYWSTSNQGFGDHDPAALVPWAQATMTTYDQACDVRGEGLPGPPGMFLVPGAEELDAVTQALDDIGAERMHTYAVMTQDGQVFNVSCDTPPPESAQLPGFTYTPVK